VTRIIAGSAKGHRLQVPRAGTRPTSDRVREAMFSTIGSWLASQDRPWSSVAVLDLFAGSGALGLEAASRGAEVTVLVERNPRVAAVIRRNAQACGLDHVRVLVAPALSLPARAGDLPPFDLCLVDPPYELDAVELGIGLAGIATGWLNPQSLLVVERPAGDGRSPLPADWVVIDERRYGDTCLWYGRMHQG